MSEIEADTHNGVWRMFGFPLVTTGRIEKEFARIFTAEHENWEIGDYEIDIEIDGGRARQRVHEAEKFVERIEQYVRIAR